MYSIKEIIKKMIYRQKYSSDTFIKFLRKKGVQIGKNCTIYNPRGTNIDYQNPHALFIGNYVRIADGVRILTHDYSLSVIAGVTGQILGSVEPVIIGNNVFIGMNAIILNNVNIGNNVIIGAGSVVTHDCEDNYVYAGNPARKICSVDELFEKRKKNEKQRAKRIAELYYYSTRKEPNKDIFREYLMMFSDSNNGLPPELDKLMKDSGDYKKCLDYYRSHKPEFEDFDAFLKWCKLKDLK